MTMTSGAQQISRGWELKSLLQVCEKITDGTHKTPVYQETGIPFISTANLVPFREFSFGTYKRFISQKEHLFLIKRCKPEKGDLLISKIGTLGLTKRVDVDYEFSIFVGVALAKLRRDRIDGEFLEQLLNTPRMQQTMISLSPGSTRATLTIGAIEKMEIIFPHSLTEQRKIAEILSTADDAIQKTEERIERLKRIRQGLMQDLFRYGIDKNGQFRSETTHSFKDSILGRIPEEWEIASIATVGEIVTGTTPSTEKTEYYDGTYMFVSPKDIGDGVYISDTEKKISERGLRISRPIPQNSICVVCIGSTIGKIGISTFKCATNQQINTIIPNPGNNCLIIYYLCDFYLLKQLRVEAGLQAVPIVNKDTFSRLLIPRIGEDEQSRIASILCSADAAIAKEDVYRQKLLAIKRGLMEDLLSAKARVNHLINQDQIYG